MNTADSRVEAEEGSPFEFLNRKIYAWLALCLGVACFFPGYLIARRAHLAKTAVTAADLPAIPDNAISLKPGPWGNLEAIPIRISPPEEYLPIKSLEEQGKRWSFVGYTPEMLMALFSKAGLSESQRAELLDSSKWSVSQQGIVVRPSSEVIFSLSQNARRTIYDALLQIPASGARSVTAYFRPERFDQRFGQSGLPKEVIQYVKDLSFPHGRLLYFCDAPWVLERIDNYEQKVLFIKTIIAKSTLLLHLHVMPDSNVNSLLSYWSKAAWGKDIKPMLESLSKVPGGARIDLVHLLPPLPTEWLYTFPFPSSNPVDALKDCHWVALNFFRDRPDLKLTDHEMMQKIFQNDYYPVISDARYGDLIQLVRPNGDIIHTAVFIADDVVFTKNSADSVGPYMLMRFQDMVDAFSVFIPEGENLRLVILRSKTF